jgi:hypothetical protein
VGREEAENLWSAVLTTRTYPAGERDTKGAMHWGRETLGGVVMRRGE